jgi:hypothetical protein
MMPNAGYRVGNAAQTSEAMSSKAAFRASAVQMKMEVAQHENVREGGIATYPPCAVCAVCSLACSRADSASLAQAQAIHEDEDDNTPLSPSMKALLQPCGPKVPTITQSFKVRRVHAQVVQFYYFIISNKECVQTRMQKVSRTVGCERRMRARTQAPFQQRS